MRVVVFLTNYEVIRPRAARRLDDAVAPQLTDLVHLLLEAEMDRPLPPLDGSAAGLQIDVELQRRCRSSEIEFVAGERFLVLAKQLLYTFFAGFA